MSLVLDHVYCFCEPALSEASVLQSIGFNLTAGRKHQGQGTANRSVVFSSNYLELIYIDSEQDAQANVLQLHLRANWKATGRSPFGIALRGTLSAEDQSQFWEYRPPYFPDKSILIHKHNETHPEFPMLFVMPNNNVTAQFSDYTPHKIGSTNISSVELQSPISIWPLSSKVPGLILRKGTEPAMDVRLDGTTNKVIQLNDLLRLRIG